jgi:glycosidase
MIFIFDHMEIQDVKTKGESKWSMRDWKLPELKKILSGWQRKMIEWDGWSTVFFECHDQARSVSRYVDDSDMFRERGAKVLALMQTTLGGTLYLFQGKRLGCGTFRLIGIQKLITKMSKASTSGRNQEAVF